MNNWLLRKRLGGFPLIFFILLILALFLRLDHMELRGEEARRALVAMEMLANGSWWVPTLHGLPYINKPPFYMWILMVFFSSPFQISEWLLRLPGILSALATGMIIYWVGKHWLSDQKALLAAFVYLTGADLLFFGWVYAGEIDPFYAFITFGQLAILFLVFLGKRKAHWLWVSFLFAAIGILTKGLPSIVHQFLTLAALLLTSRNWKMLLNIHLWGGGLVMLALPAVFFAVYSNWHDPYEYLLHLYWESVKKSGAVSSPGQMLVHLFTFPINFCWLLFPWSLTLLFLLVKKYRTEWWRNPANHSMLILLLVNLVVYWLSPDTRNRYLYPFLPWLALMVVPLFSNFHEKWVNRVLLTLLALRIVYNLIVMPFHQQHFKARQAVNDVIEITDGESVKYFGGWDIEEYDLYLPLAGKYYQSRKTPAQIPYKIPFYLMVNNGQIIRFDSVAQSNTWYISLRRDWQKDTSGIHFEFPVTWRGSPVVLARKK